MEPSGSEREWIPTPILTRYTLIVLAIVAAALLLWQIKEALLVGFAGVLVAVVITGMARELRRIMPMSRSLSLAAVGIIAVLFMAGFILLFGPQISDQFEELTEQLPERITELRESIQEQPWGRYLLNVELDGGQNGEQSAEQSENQDGGGEEESSQSTGGMGGGGSGPLLQAGAVMVDAVGTLVLVFFLGIFFAIRPDIYRRGVTLLVPEGRAQRVDEALGASGNALWQWLIGQLIAMAFVGIAVAIGLSIVGVPLALILGIIAALFDFVPFVGPIVAAVPALLLAMAEGTQTLLFAGLVFVVVQQIEGNLITPLIQQRKVSIPPALVLLAIVGFGLIFGIPGVLLATPLAIVSMVLIAMLYVHDVLGKEIDIPGQGGQKHAG